MSYQNLSDQDLVAAYKKAKDPFAAALSAEGVTGKLAEVARSIYQQESGSGRNTKTSNAGAVGAMQIIPSTFSSVADKDWDINNPEQNLRAGIRYIKQLDRQSGGDAALTAAGYYGGSGGMEKARRGIAVSDPRNPKAPTTLEYGQQVAKRVNGGQFTKALDDVSSALLPSAIAAQPSAQPSAQDDYSSMSDDQLMAAYKSATPPKAVTSNTRASSGVNQFLGNLGAGMVRGAGSIGATILAPKDMFDDAMAGKGLSLESNRARRAAMDGGLETLGAETDSMTYGAGKLIGEIAGTAGVGSAIAAPLKAAGVASPLVQSIATGGFKAGGAGLGTRAAGGSISGAAAAGLTDPEVAGVGAIVGGALPGVIKAGGAVPDVIKAGGEVGSRLGKIYLPGVMKAGGEVGSQLGKMYRDSSIIPKSAVSENVRNLALKADEMGIKIPVDRLVNSRPANAIAAALNYVPGSGRAATEDAMASQLNRKLSNLFGQDSSNVTQSLRAAEVDLGGKFDDFLKSNNVKVSDKFIDDLVESSSQARKELSSESASIINKQIDDILDKANSGIIDGQAAYNIKKTLDRIGNRNSPEAYYARDLRKKLMSAISDSVGVQKSKEFDLLRKQYGAMSDLQQMAKNGAEGEISIARLANKTGIKNPEMQELADIATQFVRPRESQHGAAQRAAAGALTLGLAGAPALATGAAIGRMANAAINSNTLRNIVLRNSSKNNLNAKRLGEILNSEANQQMMYRLAPALSYD